MFYKRLRTIRLLFLTMSIAYFGNPLEAQPISNLTLEECYKAAKENYPLSAQFEFLEKRSELTLDNLRTTKLPQFYLNGIASWQTEAIQFPIEIPGTEPIELPLSRFQASADVLYNIYNGNKTDQLSRQERIGLAAGKQEIETQLKKLEKQVNRYYFSILLLRHQTGVLSTTVEDINSKIEIMESGYRQGIILESEVAKLKVEHLKLISQKESLHSTEKSLLAMLVTLTKLNIDTNADFEIPRINNELFTAEMVRPELKLFSLKGEQILTGQKLIEANRKPVIDAFVQAGAGYPNPLNFFEDRFSPFAIVGAKIKWNIFDWSRSEREKEVLILNEQILRTEESTFREMVALENAGLLSDISNLVDQIRRDEEIIAMYDIILPQVSSQLKNGVITSAEYLEQVNAFTAAKMNYELHVLQKTEKQIDWMYTNGF